VALGRFHTTRWTLVLSAAAGDPDARPALESLCAIYWEPVYAFVRRQGHDASEAEDLTQAFFGRLIEKEYLAQADRSRGRFRTFLLTAVRNFLANEHDRAQAQKRGGGVTHVELEEEYASGLTPEELFEKRAALALLDAAMRRLRDEYEARGNASLVPLLTEEPSAPLGGAQRVALHRMRARFRAILRELVASTVAEPEQIDDELRHMLVALGT